MFDKFQAYDLAHYRLIIESQATFHALSWAFKCKHGLKDFKSQYPVLKQEAMIGSLQYFKPLMTSNVLIAKSMAKKEDWVESVQILDGLERLMSNDKMMRTMLLYYDQILDVEFTKDKILRVPGVIVENEGNFKLFKY